ncbi:hypothetical protein NP590_13645 [Methylomonas sp. SURF-2]|uniref:Uncharacterized protein n=1 Tax=Methylomonas subterranea TaxID=2952225 RepID=A0ABT1TK96_9GAMM|nr:hypothetical protein [Methylomonas sp. SURF-2]MCQ8105154.1 hypothetical protein [Methylomonas sp. SURF-2]
MSLLSKLGKLGDIVMKPIELIADWGKEPLRKWDHERGVERDRELLNAESKNRIREMEAESAIKAKEKELETNLSIKRETEIQRIFVEIEEFRKDKELQRMIAVSEAVMKYQQELTKLNVNAINAIGNMQLELREKAQQLVYDKTIKYKALQDQAINEAADDLLRIYQDFAENEVAKGILIKAVDKRLANIIDTAHNFLLELNADIKILNQSINLLIEHGQTFIEGHLQKFHVIEATTNFTKEIENKST